MITVIIPTYNRANLLKKTIPTYYQKYVKKIIIIDDASKDNTKEVIHELMQSYPIEYYKLEKNSKQTFAKNLGIEKAETEYIYFGDDDSFLEENTIPNLLNELKNNNLDLIGGKALYMDKEYKELNVFFKKYNKVAKSELEVVDFDKMHFNFTLDTRKVIITPVTHANFLVKSSIMKKIKFSTKYIENCYREETDCILRIFEKGYKIGYSSLGVQINLPRILAVGGAHKRGIKGKLRWFYYAILNNNLFLNEHYVFLKKEGYVKRKKNILKVLFIIKEGKNILQAGIKRGVLKND